MKPIIVQCAIRKMILGPRLLTMLVLIARDKKYRESRDNVYIIGVADWNISKYSLLDCMAIYRVIGLSEHPW